MTATAPLTNTTPFTDHLYRFHGFQVLDRNGKRIGQIDWIWPDAGEGEIIGVHLQWLRGRARAVPARHAFIDMAGRTIQVPYTADEVRRAQRHAINREIPHAARRAIRGHYARVPTLVVTGKRLVA